jgi:UDP-glucose 4-epimerase
MGEKMCDYYGNKTKKKFISLRLSNGFGSPIFKENSWSWLVINDLCKMAYYEKKIVLQSDGAASRDFIHVSDVAKAVEHVFINGENIESGIYNLSSGRMSTLLEIAHIVKIVYFDIFESIIPVYHSSDILSEKYDPQIIETKISNQKLLNTGFEIETSIESGIREIFNYFQTN